MAPRIVPLAPQGPNQRLGATICAIGDSITANGCTSSSRAAGSAGDGWPGQLDGRNWLMWASLYSNGKLRYGGIAATGSYTSTQVRTTHLPTVLNRSDKPAFCAVLAGTNDVPLGDGDTLTTLTAIYNSLARAGITPVCCSLTPRNDYGSTSVKTITRLNQGIARVAARNNWPFCDFYTAVADTTTGVFTSGLNGDNVHPNAAGAKLMGQALANTLSSLVAPTVLLPASNADTAGFNGSATGNPLMVTDTNADNIPDGWAADFGSATHLLENPDSGDVVGKWWQTTRTASSSAFISSGTVPIVTGNKVLLVCRIKTTVKASSGWHRLEVVDNNKAGQLFSLHQWAEDIPASTIAVEMTVPASGGFTGTNFQVRKYMETGSGIVVSLGQLQLIDLSAIEMA